MADAKFSTDNIYNVENISEQQRQPLGWGLELSSLYVIIVSEVTGYILNYAINY